MVDMEPVPQISLKNLLMSFILLFCSQTQIHRVAVTLFRSISIPAGFRRHLVGKTVIMFVAVKSPEYTLSIS